MLGYNCGRRLCHHRQPRGCLWSMLSCEATLMSVGRVSTEDLLMRMIRAATGGPVDVRGPWFTLLTGAMFGSVVLLQPGTMLTSMACVTTKRHTDICGLCMYMCMGVCMGGGICCLGPGQLPGTMLVSLAEFTTPSHVDVFGLCFHQEL